MTNTFAGIRRFKDRNYGLPISGKLYKGAKKTKNQPGEDLSYFRFESDNRPDVVASFHAFYGEQPRVLEIFLPYPTPEENFMMAQEEWSKGGLAHRCDGETCTLWRQDDGTYSTEATPCPGGCTETGYLKVILPGLVKEGIVGPTLLVTHAVNDILGIDGTLNTVYEARQESGKDLRGVRFTLRRSLESISTPPWKDDPPDMRRRIDKWLVRLEPSSEWVKLQLEIMYSEAMGLPEGETLGLPNGLNDNGVDPDEPENMIEGKAEEWFPSTWEELGEWISDQFRDPQEAKTLLGIWFGKVDIKPSEETMKAYYHALNNHYQDNPLPEEIAA